MKKLKAIISLLILNLILSSCGTLGEAGSVLRNEKQKNSDQYLIQKKDPLTIPPNYKDVPVPGSIRTATEKKDNPMKKFLETNRNTTTRNTTTSSTTENSILKKIK